MSNLICVPGTSTQPVSLYIAVKSKAPEVYAGQKVWRCADDNYYLAEDRSMGNVYEIRLGTKLDVKKYGSVLRRVE